jgi:hypothetical protein
MVSAVAIAAPITPKYLMNKKFDPIVKMAMNVLARRSNLYLLEWTRIREEKPVIMANI